MIDQLIKQYFFRNLPLEYDSTQGQLQVVVTVQELLLFAPGGLDHLVQFHTHPAQEVNFSQQRLMHNVSLNEMKLIACSLLVAYPPALKTC
jgi:hypothetical protein